MAAAAAPAPAPANEAPDHTVERWVWQTLLHASEGRLNPSREAVVCTMMIPPHIRAQAVLQMRRKYLQPNSGLLKDASMLSEDADLEHLRNYGVRMLGGAMTRIYASVSGAISGLQQRMSNARDSAYAKLEATRVVLELERAAYRPTVTEAPPPAHEQRDRVLLAYPQRWEFGVTNARLMNAHNLDAEQQRRLVTVADGDNPRTRLHKSLSFLFVDNVAALTQRQSLHVDSLQAALDRSGLADLYTAELE